MDSLEIAHQGAISLVKLLQKDGSFKYRYNAHNGESLSGYNVLRHAGTIWSLLDVYKDANDNQILDCSKDATTYLLDTYLRFFRHYNSACICEDNKIKLGGNALSALALLALFETTGDIFLLTVSEQLGRFMLEQRSEHGKLVHKRYFKSGKISGFESMYYTGEALLALLFLYRLTNEKKWLDAVIEIEDELCPEDYGVKEQSHWMLYSLEALSQHDASPIFYNHAKQIACHILDNPDYLSWNRSTPIACRTEGLLAFIRMKQPAAINDQSLKQRCLQQAKSNLKRQLEYRQSDGTFIRGGGDKRNDEVRIDYIQHNISSFIHYHRIEQNMILPG